jgi:predicted metal-dependent hydrolase
MTTPTATNHDPRPYVAAIARRAGLPMSLDWRVEISGRRKYLGADIDPAGTDTPVKVTFKVPAGADPDDIVAAVIRMRRRLLPTVEDMRDHGAHIATKDLVSGEGFPFVGQNYRLNVVDDAPHSIEDGPGPSTWSGVRTWQLTLRRADAAAATIIEWYRARGRAWLDKTLPRMAERLNIREGLRWEVLPDGDMRGAWARYTPAQHLITVSWVVFQMPRPVLDVVLWHEVAHAATPGAKHGPAWERAFARVMPDWRDRNQAAREATGLTLWLGAVSRATVRTVPLGDGPAPGTADNGMPVDAAPTTWTATGPAPAAVERYGVGPTWSAVTDTGATFVRYAARPRVGDHVATGSHGHGVCPVIAVRDHGRELSVTIPGGKSRKISRDVQGTWVIMTPDTAAASTGNTDPWGTVL